MLSSNDALGGVAGMLSTILIMMVIGAIPCVVIIAVNELLARKSLARIRH
jgi:hypothetical protein